MGRVFVIANQKGGVGKTSIAVNLSASLAHYGRRVLLIDLDPQGNATTGSGVDKTACEHTVYGVLLGEYPLAQAVRHCEGNYDIVPSNRELAGADVADGPGLRVVRQHREAVEKMQHHHLVGLADRGEVVHAIPLRDEVEIARELLHGAVGQLELHRRDTRADLLRERHARPSCTTGAASARRLRCTSSSEIAAGVTPWMRAACPTVSGRCCASFCATSFERPRIAA